MRYLLLLVVAAALTGCTGAFGVGGEDGVGLKSSVGIDGKIVEIAPADGNGDPK
ncbi:MAG: hypothetical protein ABSH20_22205 [Tepidisphaeraceae bacterium]|jgi:hypothetical protein